ncbi:MAG: hypothetical protein ABI946_12150 [Chthoniobacterales bacterium]
MNRPPEIKEPCPMRWEEMRGDARSRFCEHCQLHVHNLSALPQRGVAGVLRRSRTERMCVTYTRRADGSMWTRRAAMRERFAKPFRRSFSWLLAAFVPMALGACATEPPRQQITGIVTPNCQSTSPVKTASQDRAVTTGGI